jgi:two-component sensor histidine kinase
MVNKGPYKFIFFERGNSDSFKTLVLNDLRDLFGYSDEVYDLPDLKFLKLLKFSNHSIDIYAPYNNGDDFIVTFLSAKNWSKEEKGRDVSHFIGRLFSQMMPYHTKIGILDMLRKVYLTGVTVDAKILILDSEDNLIFSYESKVLKDKNMVFVISSNETDNDHRSENISNVFDEYTQAVAISQNRHFVKKNQKFLNLEEKYFSFDFSDLDFVGLSTSEWYDIYDRVAAREMLSFKGEVEIFDDDGLNCYLLTFVNSEIFNDKPAVKFYFLDITDFHNKQEKAKVLKENLVVAQRLNKFALLHADNRGLVDWDSEIYEILELNNEEIENIPLGHNIFDDYTSEEDFESFYEWLNKGSSEIYNNFIKITTARGNEKYLNLYGFSKRDEFDGDHVSVVSYVQDLTDEVMIQEKLKILQKDVKSGIAEEEILLKEIHHRVKNNLQIILSLLNIDMYYNKNEPEVTIQNTINRIESMALMHEKTYQSDSLDGANVKNYVESQSREIINLYGANNIELLCDIDDVELSMDIIIPLGLMINELILNTIKYAFPEGGGHLWISLKIVGYGMVLTVCDDGVGLPDDFDVHTSNSLGMTILQTLSKQIDGEFVNLNPERGTSIQISFPIK